MTNMVVQRYTSTSPQKTSDQGDSPSRPRLFTRRTTIYVITTATITFLSIGAGIVGHAYHSSPSETVKRDNVNAQREHTRVKSEYEVLPEVKDAQRGIRTARETAIDVADLQNSYRPVVKKVDERVLKHRDIATVEHNLIPHFSPTTPRETLRPWFLLAHDRTVSMDAGDNQDFDSGFEWVAYDPQVIRKDGTIPVVWVAKQRTTKADEVPVIFAWVTAQFSPQTHTLSTPEIHITDAGERVREHVEVVS